MIIKVCGMREPENIRAIEQAGADWMGFIFFPQSVRHVSHRPEYLPEQCRRIGVFVNESSENILLKAQEFGLHHIQLHGRETPEQCRKLKAAGLGIIKVFSIAREIDLRPSAVMRAFAITFFSTLPVPDMAVPAKLSTGISCKPIGEKRLSC